jgi:chitin synthase
MLFTFMILAALFFGSYIIISKTVFKPYNIYRPVDVYQLGNKQSWAFLNGYILDMKPVIAIHPTVPLVIIERLGQDISDLFEGLPADQYPEKCGINLTDSAQYPNYLKTVCPYTEPTNTTYCHPYLYPKNSSYYRGDVTWLLSDLAELDRRQHWVVIHGRAYNTTNYYNGKYSFLDPEFNSIIFGRDKMDASDLYDRLFGSKTYLDCFDALFFVGTLDTRTYIGEFMFNMIYTILFCLICLMVIVKLFAAIFTLGHIPAKQTKHHTLVMITAYTEGHEALYKTINMAAKSNYSNDHKCIFVVCDGLVKGQGEDHSTPEIVLNILRSNPETPSEVYRQYIYPNNETFAYHSLKGSNMAQVFHGKYQGVDYVVVVKVGMPEEAKTAKPGNRSKRDSQVLLLSFLNRIFYHRQANMSELDRRLLRAFSELGRSADDFEFLMTLDADTRPDEDALMYLAYEMHTRRDVLACTGETRVFNKFGSWVTAIQVYSYFTGFALTKAFESLWGSVTCCPGCMSLYRIKFIPKGKGKVKPGIIHDKLIRTYANRNVNSLHTKNLLHLGEDRFLTTLMLKYFPERKITYVADAFCHTVVPDSYLVFMSQQRRWSNSSIHNMFELLTVPFRGICCFSMKFVILVDLLSAFILPSSLLYLGYLIYSIVTTEYKFPLVLVIMLSIIFGSQLIIIMIRHQPKQVFWLLIYILSLPIWVLIIPVYSVAKSDTFSWGATRKTAVNQNSDNSTRESSETGA